jgi:DnaA-homolog protein
MKQLALGIRLRADAVFESFAPGPNSEVIAALRTPDSPPLWLWGAGGSGKTHLLQAVCSAAGDAAAYFPLVRALALPPEALTGFERSQVLCIDDVDAVAADPVWEEALFRLFNEAAEFRTRLIFAAGVPPTQAPWSLGDWRSRAAACVVYHLRELDDDGRIQALQLRAAQRGLQLPYETSEYLLKRMPRDLKSLLEVLDALDEASLVAQRRLTIPFIRDALEKHAGTKS